MIMVLLFGYEGCELTFGLLLMQGFGGCHWGLDKKSRIYENIIDSRQHSLSLRRLDRLRDRAVESLADRKWGCRG